MTETQKRIKAYQDALPGLRERVAAVALLLVMSMAMMTSASFAWLTISRSPEVSGVSTNIAANGSLEIALATGDGTKAPGESKVGDSSAAEGQSVFNANQTWGNLINLSDPAYGLDHLALRPAQLNTAALLTSPLYGAVYGQDGRITQLSSDFGYATWVPPTPESSGYFGVSDEVGVRAISSTTVYAVGAAAKYINLVNTARNKNIAAGSIYASLANNDDQMKSLATMMGLYMTAKMNSSNPTVEDNKDLENLRDMYSAFLNSFDAEADAMAALANLFLFLKHGDGNYTPYTSDMIYSSTEAKLKDQGIQITNLDEFIRDRNTILTDYGKLAALCDKGGTITWTDSGLNGIVNNLVNVGTCTLDGTPINDIGLGNAMGYISGTHEARITNGILYRFEQRTGGYIEVKALKIPATVKGITASVTANIQTSASRDYNVFTNDLAYAESLNTGEYEGGVPVAEDTYGLAVDFWVRTNAEGSFLTLEGNVLVDKTEVDATTEAPNGATVLVYSLTRNETVEENGTITTITTEYSLYKLESKDENNNTITTWYNAENHVAFTLNEGENPIQKKDTLETVVGFEGENRVWDKGDQLSVDATTQGSGSCYVYYADTPEDQAKSLRLLEAFNVAFVNEKGRLLATAVMDTQHHYASSGRVIVPLILSPSNAINLGDDGFGNITYAITALEKNVPSRITAIVYLDGTKLSNQEVLAAADIQGQLNIQFGSDTELKPIDNETLENKIRKVSATVDKTAFDYDSVEGPMVANVTVHVDGDEPTNVTAFFLRSINATQGSREQAMTFEKNEAGEWVATYEFLAPGKYVLRSIQLDGIEYDLETPCTVEVSGFAIERLSCIEAPGNHIKVMTATGTSSVNLEMKFGTDDVTKLPKKVQGRFLRADGTAVNVDFVYNPTTQIWSGSATFLVSGEYALQYLILDGEYVELDRAYWLTADITLGMRVEVFTTSPQKFKYIPSEMTEDMKMLGMQVVVMDNAGEEMHGLSNVKLKYGMRGSGIKSMDVDLVWNGAYYVGAMSNGGPGIWQFHSVTVGNDVLTTATRAPVFTIQSPEPPEYDSHSTSEYQYKPSNDATMNVVISNSGAATVQAYIIKDGAKEGAWVEGTIGQDTSTNDGKPANYWNFAVPKDVNGSQEGRWTLTDLRLSDVFAADGTPYTEDAPLEIAVAEHGIKTKVVSRIYAAFTADKSAEFGKSDDGTVTGTFLQQHTVSGLSLQIHDFEGQKITAIGDTVKLSYVYGNDSQGYGSYTSQQLTNALANFEVVLEKSDDGITFNQKESVTLQYAGSYTPSFTYTVMESGKDPRLVTVSGENLPTNSPKFSVWSKAPTVKVTATDPKPGTTKRVYSVKQPTTAAQAVQGDFFSFSDYRATVYIHTPASGGGFDQEAAEAYAPTVTLALSGVPSGYSNATMVFTTANADSNNSTFNFTNGTATATVGKAVTGERGWFGVDKYPECYPAGTMTQDKITITYGDISYDVTLAHDITLDQPQSPTVLVFAGIPETYTGQRPAQVVGQGTAVTVTLPSLYWNATIEEPKDGTWSAYTAVGEADSSAKRLSYTTWTQKTTCGSTTYYTYQYYTWTKFQSSITAQTDIYTQDKKIVRWIINGQTYNAGEEITVTGEGILTATAVVMNEGAKVFVETKTQTTYKYLYGYVAEAKVTKTENAPDLSVTAISVGNNENAALVTPKLADISKANAATDTPGTNTTTDVAGYATFLP